MDSNGVKEKYHELEGATEILLIMAFVEIMGPLLNRKDRADA